MKNNKRNTHQYTQQVNQLLPYFNTDMFEEHLIETTSTLPSSAKLSIKMEIKRLSEPCDKGIDLRGRVIDECRKYIIDGKTLWMNDTCLNYFMSREPIYKSRFTQGLKEEILSLIKPNELSHLVDDPIKNNEKPWLRASFFEYQNSFVRKESRYKLVSAITAVNQSGKILHATSLDISKSGLKIKVSSKYDYQLDDILQIYFFSSPNINELSKIDNAYAYRVVRIGEYSHSKNYISLGLAAVDDYSVVINSINKKNSDPQNKLIEESGGKMNSLKMNTLQSYISKNNSSLTLFLNNDIIQYVYLNHNNSQIWHYWLDDNSTSYLDQIISGKKHELLIKHKEINIYCFSYYDVERKYYFCVTDKELIEDDLLLAWQLSAPHDTWRIFKVRLKEIKENTKKIHVKNINSISHMVTIDDITNTSTKDDYLFNQLSHKNTENLNKYTIFERKSRQIKVIKSNETSVEGDELVNFLLENKKSTSYFLSKEKGRISVYTFFISQLTDFINHILIDKRKAVNLTLEAIYHEELIALLKQTCRKETTQYPQYIELYIGIFQVTRKKTKTLVKQPSDFASYQERREFIHNARTLGQFIALRNQIMPVRDILDSLQGPEVTALLVSASNKIRDFEQELSNLVGLGEISDITDEVLLRYK
ncbi:PilZ domain-containing protein [Veronia pacifica]|uniref:PilZ domain-containing protein n=1 Tax=Veronia pacifica TaxID=1080227 RepID=A0A1C3EJX1_9GAMM|nr:PilZ domain-containing protein [Veronia pacifica]ODA33537.1 hypothetical protein A8L45_10025 [Veronia pacifica]